MRAIIEIGERFLEAIDGDITAYDGDAIVNAANNHFWMGGGVAGAIKRKAEPSSKRMQCVGDPSRWDNLSLPVLEGLRTKFVVHAAVMGQDLQTDSAKIRSATRSALDLADSVGITTMAFPALGTGVGGFPISEAAKIMVGESSSFLKSSKHLKTVTFILFDSSAYETFANEIRTLTK